MNVSSRNIIYILPGPIVEAMLLWNIVGIYRHEELKVLDISDS